MRELTWNQDETWGRAQDRPDWEAESKLGLERTGPSRSRVEDVVDKLSRGWVAEEGLDSEQRRWSPENI